MFFADAELSHCQSYCLSSAAVGAAGRVAVRAVIRAQPLSVLLSELLLKLSCDLSCCQNIGIELTFSCKLAKLMNNQQCQIENLAEPMAVFGITMDIRTLKPLHTPMQLKLQDSIALNWIAENLNRIAKGVSFADHCSAGKVTSCCALEIYYSPY